MSLDLLRVSSLLGAVGALVLTAGSAHASFPAGVWALPESVSIEGADTATPTVVVQGLFTVHTGVGPLGGAWGNPGFEEPVEGYFYYRCPEGEAATCLMVWRDIDLQAKDVGCVGWGSTNEPAGRVRSLDEEPSEPDLFALGVGIVGGYGACNFLEAWEPPTPGDVPNDGEVIDPSEPPAGETPPTGGQPASGTPGAMAGDCAAGGGGGALPVVWIVALALIWFTSRRQRWVA